MSDKAIKPDIIGLSTDLIISGIKIIFKFHSIRDVIKGTHLRNKEGEEPYLLKKHKTDTGIDYVFSLPAGVDRSDFEKNRHYFEAYLNTTVEIETGGRRLILKTHKSEFPKEIKFSFDPSLY